jgi:leucyl-tRNA synthetase
MSRLTKCNYCNLERMRKQYGADRIKLYTTTESGKVWPVGWTEVRLVERNGEEKFLAVFVKLTNQCVC